MPTGQPFITSDSIRLLQQGKEEGYDFFFHTWYKTLSFFAFRFIDNRLDAEDIVQDAFIRLWEKRADFSNEVQVKSYLFKTVHFRCLDYVKLHKNQPAQSILENAEEPVVASIVRAETWREVNIGIDRLPAAIGKVIHLIYSEGKSLKETAEILHKSPNTIKVQRNRGIALLRAKYRGSLFLFFLWPLLVNTISQ